MIAPILEQEVVMLNPVTIKTFEVKSHAQADEVRTPNKTRIEVVHFKDFTIGRFRLDPGWRWSECIKPVVKTDLCQVSHLGHVCSGSLTVAMADGTKKTLHAGDSYTIPPGHDAWVEGDQPFTSIEVLSADRYAKPS
jgi:hypothetical protein